MNAGGRPELQYDGWRPDAHAYTVCRMLDPEVFDADELFDEEYLYFFGPLLDPGAPEEASLIVRLLEAETGALVLDLCCGHGRISNELARLGYPVTGLDRSPLFLSHARSVAAEFGVEVDYVEGDMRELPFADRQFDAVVSWFTSFGYLNDDENRSVLREACRVLRPGGRLLIEANNLAELLPRWKPATVIEQDGDLVVDRPAFDPVSGRAVTERAVIRNGRVRRFAFSVRMFIAAELADWLRAAGFREVSFVDGEGQPLTARGRRMIAIARR